MNKADLDLSDEELIRELKQDLLIIKNEIDSINAKLDKLLRGQADMTLNTTKMSTHIDFINRVYNQLRHPLNLFFNWSSPPAIEDGQNSIWTHIALL